MLSKKLDVSLSSSSCLTDSSGFFMFSSPYLRIREADSFLTFASLIASVRISFSVFVYRNIRIYNHELGKPEVPRQNDEQGNKSTEIYDGRK